MTSPWTGADPSKYSWYHVAKCRPTSATRGGDSRPVCWTSHMPTLAYVYAAACNESASQHRPARYFRSAYLQCQHQQVIFSGPIGSNQYHSTFLTKLTVLKNIPRYAGSLMHFTNRINVVVWRTKDAAWISRIECFSGLGWFVIRSRVAGWDSRVGCEQLLSACILSVRFMSNFVPPLSKSCGGACIFVALNPLQRHDE